MILILTYLFFSINSIGHAQVVPRPVRLWAMVNAKQHQAFARKFDAPRCRGFSDFSQRENVSYIGRADGSWQCTILLKFPETEKTSTLFIQIWGPDRSTWKSFRLRLNFSSPISRQFVCERAASVLKALADRPISTFHLEKRLSHAQDFEEVIAGIRIKYLQEGVEASRFSLFGTNSAGLSKDAIEWELRR